MTVAGDATPSVQPQEAIPPSANPGNGPQAKESARQVNPRPFYVQLERWKVPVELVLAFVIAFATVASVCIATRQWYAMIDNNRIAQTALTSIQRAFITVSELKQDPIENNGWRFTPIIKNSGTTPAVEVSIAAITPHQEATVIPPTSREYAFASFRVGAPPDPDEILTEAIQPLGAFIVRGITIGPQAVITTTEIADEFTSNYGIDAQAGKIGRFFYGSIRYRDVFNAQHISKYCFRIDGFKIIGGQQRPYQSICRHWNCTDDYCIKDKYDYEKELKKAVAEGARRRPFPPAQNK